MSRHVQASISQPVPPSTFHRLVLAGEVMTERPDPRLLCPAHLITVPEGARLWDNSSRHVVASSRGEAREGWFIDFSKPHTNAYMRGGDRMDSLQWGLDYLGWSWIKPYWFDKSGPIAFEVAIDSSVRMVRASRVLKWEESDVVIDPWPDFAGLEGEDVKRALVVVALQVAS